MDSSLETDLLFCILSKSSFSFLNTSSKMCSGEWGMLGATNREAFITGARGNSVVLVEIRGDEPLFLYLRKALHHHFCQSRWLGIDLMIPRMDVKY